MMWRPRLRDVIQLILTGTRFTSPAQEAAALVLVGHITGETMRLPTP